MVFLLKPLSFFRELGQQSVLLQRGKGLGDRAIELIEVLLAGQGLAELLESGKFRLGLGRRSPFSTGGWNSFHERPGLRRSAFPSW